MLKDQQTAREAEVVQTFLWYLVLFSWKLNLILHHGPFLCKIIISIKIYPAWSKGGYDQSAQRKEVIKAMRFVHARAGAGNEPVLGTSLV
jgi:hypothetical protein